MYDNTHIYPKKEFIADKKTEQPFDCNDNRLIVIEVSILLRGTRPDFPEKREYFYKMSICYFN